MSPNADRAHHVYRIFGADDLLLYIGCTENVESRLYMHRATWTLADADLIHHHFTRHTSEAFPSLAAARVAERHAIETEAPLLNRQHNPKRWRRVSGRYVPVDAATADARNRLLTRPAPDAAIKALLDSMFSSVTA